MKSWIEKRMEMVKLLVRWNARMKLKGESRRNLETGKGKRTEAKARGNCERGN